MILFKMVDRNPILESFEIELDDTTSSLIITKGEDTMSIPVDHTRENIKKGLIIGTFILGGTLIGGPIGLLISAKIAVLATAGAGAVAGAGVGMSVWEKTKETLYEGKTTWMDEVPLVTKFEESIYGMVAPSQKPELALMPEKDDRIELDSSVSEKDTEKDENERL